MKLIKSQFNQPQINVCLEQKQITTSYNEIITRFYRDICVNLNTYRDFYIQTLAHRHRRQEFRGPRPSFGLGLGLVVFLHFSLSSSLFFSH